MRSSVFQSGARRCPSSRFEVKRLLFAELLLLMVGFLNWVILGYCFCQLVFSIVWRSLQLVSLHWNFFTVTGNQQVHFTRVPRSSKQDPNWGCLLGHRGRDGGEYRDWIATDPWQRESLVSELCIRTQIQRIYDQSIVFEQFWCWMVLIEFAVWNLGLFDSISGLAIEFVEFAVGTYVSGTLDFAWFSYNESLVC